MKEKIQKINDYEWLIPKSSREKMKVDAKIFANKNILDDIEDDAVSYTHLTLPTILLV